MALIGLGSVQAQSPDLDALVNNSPFGKAPPANTGPGASAAENPLEFRGVFHDAGETFFSLYDVAGRQALWVGLKEAGNPFVVQAYDEAKGAVVVEYQGRTLTVSLKQAKVVTLPPAAVAPAVQVASGNVAAPVAVAASAGTPPNEAARLAQIAEEIRRRRAIRAQAVQQNATGQPPASPPSPSGTRP